MPVLGLTKLQMLNKLLAAIGMPRATALPSDGADVTSVVYDGEQTLDEIARKVLIMGWPCNTIRNKAYTSTGSPSEIAITNVLRVHCTGPDRYAGRLSILGDDVYIESEGTTDFGGATTVNLDVVLNITLEDASPDLKERIADAAAQIFQRRQKGSQTQDGYLTEEAVLSDLFADRLVPGPASHLPPWNQQAIISPALTGGGDNRDNRRRQ